MTEDVASSSVVEPGDILADKYRVERVLGMGGMGVVVLATHIELEERVALKFLLPEVQSNGEAVQRFAREARAAVKIKSEHVARTFDVGKLDNGCPYMVMEYLQGADLGERLQQHGPLPIDLAVGFVLQALDAVAEAHALGIVHRDIKPANLFVVRRNDGSDTVKVLDFGISKVTGPAGAMSMTRTAAVLGSPLYMSPEQMESAAKADARSDIWALGVTLFELLSGTVPFSGTTYPEVCMRVMTQPTPPVRQFRPDVPEQIDQILMNCTAKNPAERYQNVGELAMAMVGFAPESMRHTAARVSRVVTAAGLAESSPGIAGPAPVASVTATSAVTGAGLAAPMGAATAAVGGAQALSGSSAGGPLPGASPASTEASWGQTAGPVAGASSRRVWPVLAALASLLALVLAGGGVAWWQFSQPGAEEASGSAAAGGVGDEAMTATPPPIPEPPAIAEPTSADDEARSSAEPPKSRDAAEGEDEEDPDPEAGEVATGRTPQAAPAPTRATPAPTRPTARPRPPRPRPRPTRPTPTRPTPRTDPNDLTDFGGRT